MTNFVPEGQGALEQWIAAVEDEDAEGLHAIGLVSPFDKWFEDEWVKRNGGTPAEISERIKQEAWEVYYRENSPTEAAVDAPKKRGRPKKAVDPSAEKAPPRPRGRPRKVVEAEPTEPNE